MIVIFLDQALYLNAFRQLRERQTFLLNLLDLDCHQLKIVHMTHFGEALYELLHMMKEQKQINEEREES